MIFPARKELVKKVAKQQKRQTRTGLPLNSRLSADVI